MVKEFTVNENGTLTVIWTDGGSDTWKPSDDVDLTDYYQIGLEIRRYAGI